MNESVQVTLRMKPQSAQWLKQHAAELGYPVNIFVDLLVRNYHDARGLSGLEIEFLRWLTLWAPHNHKKTPTVNKLVGCAIDEEGVRSTIKNLVQRKIMEEQPRRSISDAYSYDVLADDKRYVLTERGRFIAKTLVFLPAF
jgi:hypothetical protein